MKHLEVTFTNLSFGNLADVTAAKFNKLHEKLDFWTDDKLLKYQRKHQNVREEHTREEQKQAHFRQREAERQLALVRDSGKIKFSEQRDNILNYLYRRLRDLTKLTKLLEVSYI